MSSWNKQEDETLSRLYREGVDISEISRDHLQNRSEDSCRNRLRRLGLFKRKAGWTRDEVEYLIQHIYDTDEEVAKHLSGKSTRIVRTKRLDIFSQRKELAEAALLFHLRSEGRMVSLDRLVGFFTYPMEWEDLVKLAKGLSKRGYDVRIDTTYDQIGLITSGKSRLGEITGHVETPLAVISDTHISSKGFSEKAWRAFIADISLYGVKHIIMAGDVIQSRGVFRSELDSLSEVSIDDQIARAIELFRMIPSDVQIWLILGNHEEKIKGNIHVGLDPLKMMAMAMPNIHYLGYEGEVLVNGKYRWILMHGEGNITDNPSHKLEHSFRSMSVGGGMPDGLVMGHYHVLLEIDHPGGRVLFSPGTFQKHSNFTVRKGIPVEIGWKILLELEDDRRVVVTRYPQEV